MEASFAYLEASERHCHKKGEGEGEKDKRGEGEGNGRRAGEMTQKLN